MPHESRSVSEAIPKEALGSLGGCLVEGDPEQRSRECRVRRRALATSILIQTAVLALLLLLPLFAKTQHLAFAISTPVPPYSPYKGPSPAAGAHPHGDTHRACHICAPTSIPLTIVTHDPQPTSDGSDAPIPDGMVPGIPGGGGLIPIPDNRAVVPPQREEHRVTQPSVLHVTHLDPAMLIHRVEPVYPNLPRQIHKEGRVELRARIATDGTIRGLEIVSGDLMFYESAKQAVLQWRYRPTVLNGQPVEIDTYITVVYTMSH